MDETMILEIFNKENYSLHTVGRDYVVTFYSTSITVDKEDFEDFIKDVIGE